MYIYLREFYCVSIARSLGQHAGEGHGELVAVDIDDIAVAEFWWNTRSPLLSGGFSLHPEGHDSNHGVGCVLLKLRIGPQFINRAR